MTTAPEPAWQAHSESRSLRSGWLRGSQARRIRPTPARGGGPLPVALRLTEWAPGSARDSRGPGRPSSDESAQVVLLAAGGPGRSRRRPGVRRRARQEGLRKLKALPVS